MHVTERERLILDMMADNGFALPAVDARLEASPATIRRDLEQMAQEGRWSASGRREAGPRRRGSRG